MVQLISAEEERKVNKEVQQPKYEPKYEQKFEKKPFVKKNGGGGKGGYRPRPAPRSAVDGFIARDIKIKMRDGTFENGKLETITQYEIVIIGSDGMPVIIMKHAVDLIRLKVV